MEVGEHIEDVKPDGDPPSQNLRRLPNLSQEIYDSFIDMLNSSGPTARADLQACALTCRAWLHRSRSILYRRIRLKPLTNIEHFSEIYTPERLLPYVREVAISGCLMPHTYHGRDADSGLGLGGQPDHAWITVIVPLLARFSNIEWLVLNDLSWGYIETSTRHFLLTHFSSAPRVTLSAIDFWNSNQLFRTLQSFPRLAGLSLESISWHKANHSMRQLTRPEPLTLRYLHLGHTEFARYGPFVRWMIGNRDTVTVDEALITWEDTEIRSLVDLMRTIAPSLKLLVYQQSATLPGSDVVQARFATMNTQAAMPGAAIQPAVHNGGQAAALAPIHDDHIGQGELPHVVAPANILDDHAFGGFHVHLGVQDHDFGFDDDDDDDDDSDSSPPLELDDDEPEDPEVIEKNDEENTDFVREDEANQRGLELLRLAPIERSAIARILARIVWSTMAPFGIKLVCQLLSTRTKLFSLTLLFPAAHLWHTADWGTIDAMLDDATPRAPSGTLFVLALQSNTQVNISWEDLRKVMAAKLPRLFERRVWGVRFGKTVLWPGCTV